MTIEPALVQTMLVDLEAQATGFEMKAAAARELMASLRKVYELGDATNGAGEGRRAPIAAGSLEDRILGALRDEPLSMSDLVDRVKARPPDVRKAVGELIYARRVVKTGKSRATRYRER